MSAEYDKQRTAALIKEAREITNHLKVEMESLKRQIARVLDGDPDEPGTPTENRKVIEEMSTADRTIARRSGWLFWR